MRKIIFHYHLFKNAGTSLDSQLKKNVSENQWVTREFPGPPEANRKKVSEWLKEEPSAQVFSSHTACFPPPKMSGVRVLPIIFIRHPIDRLASIYAFERKQGTDNFGAVLARNTNFSGYIESRLAIPRDRLCRNFHTERLAMMYAPKVGSEMVRAEKALAELPFVGVVDRFDASLVRLERWLHAEGFADFQLEAVKENVSRDGEKTLAERLEDIRQEVGDTVYQKLLDANEDDLILYRQACEFL
ncbi:sulfotransferase family 2 domain-containing protein [Gilvimarinus algae]|uniref:Sulfotransferase family 2 domain-containing protein n=1 Tax=Gilvimarinus algae TaxID=3058037 RepID=A0ABT8TGQ1_9GAMM|nr:sulfotransferase family 2 domain-containing protein [Gilvimarinus sp. SDUM040014]MDO3381866.1 sulfotransferase family 2 domain-containing protein [Gilvimarinus sp. SDUM040014]